MIQMTITVEPRKMNQLIGPSALDLALERRENARINLHQRAARR